MQNRIQVVSPSPGSCVRDFCILFRLRNLLRRIRLRHLIRHSNSLQDTNPALLSEGMQSDDVRSSSDHEHSLSRKQSPSSRCPAHPDFVSSTIKRQTRSLDDPMRRLMLSRFHASLNRHLSNSDDQRQCLCSVYDPNRCLRPSMCDWAPVHS